MLMRRPGHRLIAVRWVIHVVPTAEAALDGRPTRPRPVRRLAHTPHTACWVLCHHHHAPRLGRAVHSIARPGPCWPKASRTMGPSHRRLWYITMYVCAYPSLSNKHACA